MTAATVPAKPIDDQVIAPLEMLTTSAQSDH